jgi:hypothetical protein
VQARELDFTCSVRTDGGAVEAMVRYAGAQDLYTVPGNPVQRPPLHPACEEGYAAASGTSSGATGCRTICVVPFGWLRQRKPLLRRLSKGYGKMVLR